MDILPSVHNYIAVAVLSCELSIISRRWRKKADTNLSDIAFSKPEFRWSFESLCHEEKNKKKQSTLFYLL